MVIEIKCNRSNCGLINTFEISRNAEYVTDVDHSEKMIAFKFKSKT